MAVFEKISKQSLFSSETTLLLSTAWVVLQSKQSILMKKDNSQSTDSAKKSVKRTICRQPRKTLSVGTLIEMLLWWKLTFSSLRSALLGTFVLDHGSVCRYLPFKLCTLQQNEQNCSKNGSYWTELFKKYVVVNFCLES